MSSAAAPLVYVITDRHATGRRSLVDVVAAAFEGAKGLARPGGPPIVAVQLREKDLSAKSLLALAESLRTVTRDAGVSLFINDRVDVALAAEADGVHLGGGAISCADVRAIAPDLKIALSTHTRLEVEAAASASVDFVVYGPVFETPSKRNYGAPRGVESLGPVARVGVPLLALGGVEPHNTTDCVRAGAAGVATIRAIMSARDPAHVMRMFLSCFEFEFRHFDT